MRSFRCTVCNKVFQSAWARCPVSEKHTVIPIITAPTILAKPMTTPLKSSVTTPKTASTQSVVAEAINPLTINDFVREILSYFDEAGLGLLSMVCKRWRTHASAMLSQIVPVMVGYGSETHLLKNVILQHLINATDVRIAVDQFPSPSLLEGSILNYILTNDMKVSLSLGTPAKETMQRLKNAGKNVQLIKNTLNRMHNKIWVIDRKGVIVGSPNVSFSGLEGSNMESCIYIRSPRVGGLFVKYLELLKAPDPQKSLLWPEISAAMAKYNNENHNLKLALAPVVNITDFIIEELKDAKKIVIRQFLISPKQGKAQNTEGKDILEALCAMAQNGTEIEIYLDENAYTSMKFVRDAVYFLVESGCKVYTQKPVTIVNSSHEAIQHDKLILATLHSGVCRTLIGSAGFTVDVIANANAENFISTDLKSVYDSLMTHHLRTLKPGRIKTWNV